MGGKGLSQPEVVTGGTGSSGWNTYSTRYLREMTPRRRREYPLQSKKSEDSSWWDRGRRMECCSVRIFTGPRTFLNAGTPWVQ